MGDEEPLAESATSAEAESTPDNSDPSGLSEAEAPVRTAFQEWRLPVLLFVLTCASTLWAGSTMVAEDGLLAGWPFALPLMAILLAHEMGHYVAAKIHKVDTSPPNFIPMPISLLGTMGAVIQMRGRIRSRNALLDIGASGPLAGMVIAVPVLCYGVAISEVGPLSDGAYIAEGHSLFYEAVLFAFKGSIPPGQDIHLSPTALAGWAGLLVTMINLIPFGQLDGGHVSYALIGKKQDQVSRWMLRLLPVLAVIVSVVFVVPSIVEGAPEYVVYGNLFAGASWLVWWVMLLVMTRLGGREHPPTDDDTLSPKRRGVALFSLLLFVALFMPAMIRTFTP